MLVDLRSDKIIRNLTPEQAQIRNLELYHIQSNDTDVGHMQFMRCRMLPFVLIEKFLSDDDKKTQASKDKLLQIVKDLDTFKYRNSKKLSMTFYVFSKRSLKEELSLTSISSSSSSL